MSDDGDVPALPDAARLLQINRLATSARLVAGLAHELNNALQVVGGTVELLGDRADIPTDARARIHKIAGQAEKAGAAIRQVLAFTDEGAGQPGRVDLGALIQQAVAVRRYSIGRAGITVTLDLPSTPLEVTADSRALLQVLLNLVINAEEALATQPHRVLTIAARRDATATRVAVSDTGHGVPRALLERIFEPFFTTRSGERTVGLGLPAARALARQFGGQVTLEQAEGATTTFVVTWPA